MTATHYKPGEEVPDSGQAEILDRNGRRTGMERTVVSGEKFPPTPEAGQVYVYVDLTRHGRSS